MLDRSTVDDPEPDRVRRPNIGRSLLLTCVPIAVFVAVVGGGLKLEDELVDRSRARAIDMAGIVLPASAESRGTAFDSGPTPWRDAVFDVSVPVADARAVTLDARWRARWSLVIAGEVAHGSGSGRACLRAWLEPPVRPRPDAEPTGTGGKFHWSAQLRERNGRVRIVGSMDEG